MYLGKDRFVIEGEDPLFIRADEALAALCSELDKRASTEKMTFHPLSHRYDLTGYEKQIFVNEDGLLFSQGTKKYRAAWDMLADAFGKWTAEDFIKGPIEKECVSHDSGGNRYYLTDPVIFDRNIVISNEENGPIAAVPLQFHVILAGSCEKPDIEELSVCVEDPENISLLQGLLDLLEAKICLIPTDQLVRQWESDLFKRLEDERKEQDKRIDAFLNILDDDHPQEDIMHLCRHLPPIPYGSGLKRALRAWLDKNTLSFDLGFERWLLEGRSKQLWQRFSGDRPDLGSAFKTMLTKILNKVHQADLTPQFPEWTPTYREYRENMAVLEKELDWFGKQDRSEDNREAVPCKEYSAIGGR